MVNDKISFAKSKFALENELEEFYDNLMYYVEKGVIDNNTYQADEVNRCINKLLIEIKKL